MIDFNKYSDKLKKAEIVLSKHLGNETIAHIRNILSSDIYNLDKVDDPKAKVEEAKDKLNKISKQLKFSEITGSGKFFIIFISLFEILMTEVIAMAIYQGILDFASEKIPQLSTVLKSTTFTYKYVPFFGKNDTTRAILEPQFYLLSLSRSLSRFLIDPILRAVVTYFMKEYRTAYNNTANNLDFLFEILYSIARKETVPYKPSTNVIAEYIDSIFNIPRLGILNWITNSLENEDSFFKYMFKFLGKYFVTGVYIIPIATHIIQLFNSVDRAVIKGKELNKKAEEFKSKFNIFGKK